MAVSHLILFTLHFSLSLVCILSSAQVTGSFLVKHVKILISTFLNYLQCLVKCFAHSRPSNIFFDWTPGKNTRVGCHDPGDRLITYWVLTSGKIKAKVTQLWQWSALPVVGETLVYYFIETGASWTWFLRFSRLNIQSCSGFCPFQVEFCFRDCCSETSSKEECVGVAVVPTPAGCPAVHLSSDPIYQGDSIRPQRLKAQSHETAPPQVICACDRLAIDCRFQWHLSSVGSISLLERLMESRETFYS